MQEVLNDWGFEVELERPFGSYFADLFLPELNIIVEVDGSQHKLTRRRDERRDKRLVEEFGVFAVIRLEYGICVSKKRTQETLRKEFQKLNIDL